MGPFPSAAAPGRAPLCPRSDRFPHLRANHPARIARPRGAAIPLPSTPTVGYNTLGRQFLRDPLRLPLRNGPRLAAFLPPGYGASQPLYCTSNQTPSCGSARIFSSRYSLPSMGSRTRIGVPPAARASASAFSVKVCSIFASS